MREQHSLGYAFKYVPEVALYKLVYKLICADSSSSWDSTPAPVGANSSVSHPLLEKALCQKSSDIFEIGEGRRGERANIGEGVMTKITELPCFQLHITHWIF